MPTDKFELICKQIPGKIDSCEPVFSFPQRYGGAMDDALPESSATNDQMAKFDITKVD